MNNEYEENSGTQAPGTGAICPWTGKYCNQYGSSYCYDRCSHNPNSKDDD